MDLSLSKLPWYAQIGAFVLVTVGAVFGFWHFYATDMQADIEVRQTRLSAMKADIAKGIMTARQLPQFQAQVADLQRRLEDLKAALPEQKDVADILRRVQGLATQSSLTIQRFTPQDPKQQTMYAELPYKLQAEGTYHNLGLFLDRVSKFPRIINVSGLAISGRTEGATSQTIAVTCTATTFVLLDPEALAAAQPKKAAKKAPKKTA